MAYITYLDLNSDINWDSLFSYYVHLAFRSRINMFRIFIRTLQNTESKKFYIYKMQQTCTQEIMYSGTCLM
jgi:hypothetical protein